MHIGRVSTTFTTTVNHSSNAPSFAGVILDLQVARHGRTSADPRYEQFALQPHLRQRGEP